MRHHLDVAARCFLPAMAIALALNVTNWKEWRGSFIVSGVEIGVFFLVLLLLQERPSPAALVPLLALNAGGIVSSFAFFFFIVGPGEELLFRGYIQSRLNAAFGRPYTFMGVQWGWGLVIASLIFASMHILNPFNPLVGELELSLPWGLWTFFMGLILGIVREKTQSVVAPAILHAVVNFF